MDQDSDDLVETIERALEEDPDGAEAGGAGSEAGHETDAADESEPGDVPRRSTYKKKRSPIWQHYESVEEGTKHKCRACDRTFRSATSTSSLRYHIEKQHPHLLAMEQRRGQKRRAGDAPFDQARFEDLLAQAVARNGLSLRLVDDESFLRVLDYLRPGCRPPNRRRMSQKSLPALRKRLEQIIRERISTVKYYSLSLDGWTSQANRQYQTVVFYGITKEWSLEVFEMDLVPVTAEAETGAYIAEEVQEVLQRWGLQKECLVAATTDSGANVKNAVRAHLGVDWIFCLGHALNLAVRDGLEVPEVKHLLEKAKAIASFFRASPKATRLLEEQQRRQESPSMKKLKIDNRTRWNSALKMLKRLVASRPAVSASLALSNNARRRVPDDLTGPEWALLGHLIQALQPLKAATKFLSQQRTPTLAFALPIMYRLLDHHLRQSDRAPGAVPSIPDTVRLAIHAGLTKRWAEFMGHRMPECVLLAVYLDPRFKDFSFVKDANVRQRLVQRAFDAAARLLGEPAAIASQASQDMEVEHGEADAPDAHSRLADLFGEEMLGGPPVPAAASPIAAELQAYHRKSPCALLEAAPGAARHIADPLAWWKARQAKYPRVAKLARRFLCLAATSVPAERAFSKAGWIVSKRRCALSNDSVSTLSFITTNAKYLPDQQME
jgi:hypothetical protein